MLIIERKITRDIKRFTRVNIFSILWRVYGAIRSDEEKNDKNIFRKFQIRAVKLTSVYEKCKEVI